MDTAFEQLPELTRRHVERVRDYYESPVSDQRVGSRALRKLLARYYKQMIPEGVSVLEIGCGDGSLLAELPDRERTGVDLSPRNLEMAKEAIPDAEFFEQTGEALDLDGKFDYIILSETVNEAADVQMLLEKAAEVSHPGTRLILNFYSALWKPLLGLATLLKLRRPALLSNWLTLEDIKNLYELSGWQPLEAHRRILIPFQIPVISALVNRFLAPLVPWLCLTCYSTARPRPPLKKEEEYSVSVVVPARNESGNVDAILSRTPELGKGTEIILIEGNSTDDTWEKIQEAAAGDHGRNLKIMQQTGKGKGNAVREAFAASSGDILMILDADLTVPPEELPKFYEVVASRHGEFANGVRLVYPMESEAMRFANLCANKAFGLIFSWLLGQPVKDTLCGTKVLFRSDYEKVAANRKFFGDFDPFGDFDLLFGADKLNLKIVDVPIRYRDRTYGTTNIQRWRSGVILLRMVVFAARKLRFT
ncbi:MAG: glycosyltransferase [Verrucomicrobiota bacterium]